MDIETGDEDPFINYGLDFDCLRQHISQSSPQYGGGVHERIEKFDCPGVQLSSSPSHMRFNGQVVFVQGYPSTEQMSRLSKSYGIKAEFWRRHLDALLSVEEATFEDTRLPSAGCNMFQLKFWTVGSRGNCIGSNVTLSSLRKNGETNMEDYKKTFKKAGLWKASQSVVRKFEIHDRDHFSIEQVISVCIIAEEQHNGVDKSISWTDCGVDLHYSPVGPWIGSDLGKSAKFHTRFFPVPEHRLWMAKSGISTVKLDQGSVQEPTLLRLSQSLATLPSSLREGHDPNMMHKDPLHALNRIFSFYVCSEAYVLSFFEKQISLYAYPGQGTSEVADTETLSNLIHCRRLLDYHVDDLRQTLRIVQGMVPNDSRQSSTPDVISTKSSLEIDLKYLVEKAANLRSRSETLIGLLMNVASIGEVRRSVHQNRALFRFTIIASVYVPLSFVATLFGMNFRQFGQGDLSIWIYFAVSVPVFLISAAFLFVDPRDILGLRGQPGKR